MGVLNVASRKACMPKGTVAGFVFLLMTDNTKNLDSIGVNSLLNRGKVLVDIDDEYDWSDENISVEYRCKKAIEIFDRVLEINPTNAEALHLRMFALHLRGWMLGRHEGRIREALETYDRLLMLYAKEYDAQDTEKIQEEIDELKKRLNDNVPVTLGHDDVSDNKISEMLERVVRLKKESDLIIHEVESLQDKGENLMELGKYEEAIRVFDKILTIDSDTLSALFDKGVALFELEEYEDAVKVFNEVILSGNENLKIVATNRKGLALLKINNHTEALEVFNQVLEIDPDNDTALNNKKDILEEMHVSGYDTESEEPVDS